MTFKLLRVRVKPGAKQTQIVGRENDTLIIQLNAPPRDGEANKELQLFLTNELGIKKYQVELISGFKCRDKVVKLSMLTDEIRLKLDRLFLVEGEAG